MFQINTNIRKNKFCAKFQFDTTYDQHLISIVEK